MVKWQHNQMVYQRNEMPETLFTIFYVLLHFLALALFCSINLEFSPSQESEIKNYY